MQTTPIVVCVGESPKKGGDVQAAPRRTVPWPNSMERGAAPSGGRRDLEEWRKPAWLRALTTGNLPVIDKLGPPVIVSVLSVIVLDESADKALT